MKRLFGSLPMAAALVCAWSTASLAQSADKPGEGVTVRAAAASWTSAVPTSWLFVELLSELGYKVENPTTLSNPVAFLAIAEGDVDYWPETWIPLHEPQLPANFSEAATIFEPHCPKCGIEGYLVDVASIEKFGITSVEDFRRDEVRAAFDANGDGRADLFGCPPGWGCNENIENMLKKFDLESVFNHVDAGYQANFSEAVSRIKSGESAIYYTWGPSAMVNTLVPGKDVKWINVPGIVTSEAEKTEGVEGAVSDPIYMGTVLGDIHVAANNKFIEANPAAAELFRVVRVPGAWINEIDATIERDGLTNDDVRPLVRDWITENRELVDQWLDAARAAAG